jgi:LAO/AO transport system kinase
MALEMGRKRGNGWEPPLLKTEAVVGKGIPEVVSGIYRHKQALEQSKVLEQKLRERARTAFLNILQTEVMSRFIEKIEKEGQWETIIEDLVNRQTDPYSIAEKLIKEELKDH